jgi:transcriptional regulator with XRE-family HTH domain
MNRLTLARRIKALRLEGKLTLQDISTHTGFTKSYFSLIESGKKAPPIATLSKIAHALGVDIAAFFEEENSKDRITIMRENERKDFVRQGVSFGYRYQSIAPIRRNKRIEGFVVLHPSGTEKERSSCTFWRVK